jgi:hypothetical protein
VVCLGSTARDLGVILEPDTFGWSTWRMKNYLAQQWRT